jgi:hypothetical protein
MAKVNIINNSLQERRGPTGHVTVVEVIDEGKIQKDHVSQMLAAGISLLGRGKRPTRKIDNHTDNHWSRKSTEESTRTCQGRSWDSGWLDRPGAHLMQ